MISRPRTVAELAFNQDSVQKVIDCVHKRQVCLCFGAPGVGKTTSAFVAANELHLSPIEFNASDERTRDKLDDLLKRVRMHSFVPVLYLLDEIDGITNWYVLEKIVTQTKNPIVMTCNDLFRVPDSIKNRVTQIKFLNPPPMVIVNQVRKVASNIGVEKPRFENITTDDFRASLNSTLYGGSGHTHSDIFSELTDYVKTGKIPSSMDRNTLIWLYDSASKFFAGRRLYEYIQLLAEVDTLRDTQIVDRWELLGMYSPNKSGKVTYPNYLRRISVLKPQKVFQTTVKTTKRKRR